MTHFLVIANGEPPSKELFISLNLPQTQLVAVDGGLYTCLHMECEPHLLIGDFDSIDEKTRSQYSHLPQIHSPDQNKSDLEKTLDYLFEKGAENITVCGALGKRLDHTLTNICLLSRFPDKVKFETDTEVCFALPKVYKLACHIGQILSLIPLSTSVQEVFTKGLKWELSGESLSKNFVSLSNISVQESVDIKFLSGDLLVCLDKQGPSHASKKPD